MHRTLSVTAVTLLTILFFPAHADRLLLVNGDRLSGTAVRKSGDVLTFKTDYAGELSIDWNQVAELQTDAPVTVVLDDKRIVEADRFSQNGAEQAVAVDRVRYVNPPPEAGGDDLAVTGRVNVGLSQTAGNTDTQTYHLDAEAVLRKRNNRLTLGAIYNEATNGGVQSVSNATLKAKYDHFISERWYGYGNIKLHRDKFRDLKLRRDIGVGLGHQFFDQPDLKLALEAGVGQIANDYFNAPDENGASLRWAANYEQKIWRDLLTVFHEHELTLPFTDSGEFLAIAKTGVRIPVADGLTTTMQVDVDYDNQPTTGTDKTDLLYLFTLGYNW